VLFPAGPQPVEGSAVGSLDGSPILSTSTSPVRWPTTPRTRSPVPYPGSTACSRTCLCSSGRHPLGWVLGVARQRGSQAIRGRVGYCSRCGAVPYGATP